jgi:hypothetical protein
MLADLRVVMVIRRTRFAGHTSWNTVRIGRHGTVIEIRSVGFLTVKRNIDRSVLCVGMHLICSILAYFLQNESEAYEVTNLSVRLCYP